MTGTLPPEIQDLPQLKDRLSFIYLEHCKITCDHSALKAEDQEGYVLIPSHAFLVLLLGPGVSITHHAIKVLGESGTTLIWTGESGIKFYGYGKPLSENTDLLLQQAKIVSSPTLHLKAVKKMYSLRYPDEDLTDLTLRQLRGKEGHRMKNEYLKLSKTYNVPWTRRDYEVADFKSGTPINRSLSVANTCLYGICCSVICGMGLSTGLGIIHTGHTMSFVYDIADLYKAELTLPLSFELVAESTENIESRVRKAMREKVKSTHLVQRIVKDLAFILEVEEPSEEDTLMLWDGKRGSVAAGTMYHERNGEEEL